MAENKVTAQVLHIIKDPVYGSIQFTPEEHQWLYPFIDSENFQRLRHIKQLGLADWFFPGAMHTRFSHCIGCCYVASQICNKLGIQGQNKQIVVIASLLHDIGHGPFSHLFERIFHHQMISHEMWTSSFLQDYLKPDFLSHYNELNPKFPLNKQKMKMIQQLIMHQYTRQKFLADIVSSQLDADRLDYLLRDSHFCGVTYGHFDFRWLLYCLVIIEKDGEKRLGINYKGVGVVEQYLMARRLMTRNVYHHGKKYGAEFLLQKFLQYIAQDLEQNKAAIGFSDMPLIQFMRKTNEYSETIKKAKDPQQFQKNFMQENYDLYRQLCDYDIFLLVRHLSTWSDSHPAIEIAKRLQARKLPKIIYLNEEHVEKAKKMIEQFRAHYPHIHEWQLTLLTIPHSFYEIGHDPILIQEIGGKIQSLHEKSMIIKAISAQRENINLISIDREILHQPEIQTLIQNLTQLM